MNKLFLLSMFLLLIINSCSSEEDNFEPIDQLRYISLTIEKDTIEAGEEVKVKAEATGSQLEYFWSASKGDILGHGAEVIYASSPCHIGTNTITCKVTNGNAQSSTKNVNITVME